MFGRPYAYIYVKITIDNYSHWRICHLLKSENRRFSLGQRYFTLSWNCKEVICPSWSFTAVRRLPSSFITTFTEWQSSGAYMCLRYTMIYFISKPICAHVWHRGIGLSWSSSKISKSSSGCSAGIWATANASNFARYVCEDKMLGASLKVVLVCWGKC